MCRFKQIWGLFPLFGAVLCLLPAAPASGRLTVDLLFGEEEALTVVEVRLSGPVAEVIPTRVGRSLGFFFPGHQAERGVWQNLPPAVLDATIESTADGGRLLLRLAPGIGRAELEVETGRLIVRLPRGKEPSRQVMRPLRAGGLKPLTVIDAEGERPGRPPEPKPEPTPATMPEPDSPVGQAASFAGREPSPVAEGGSPPQGWGIQAPDIGLVMWLIPVEGRPEWNEIPEPIKADYYPMVVAAMISPNSPYVFTFGQREDRFRLTLPDGRSVGCLDLSLRDDLVDVWRGDPDALFHTRELRPGGRYAALVLFPAEFEPSEIRKAEVWIRGTYYEMPLIEGTPLAIDQPAAP